MSVIILKLLTHIFLTACYEAKWKSLRYLVTYNCNFVSFSANFQLYKYPNNMLTY